MIYAYCDCSFIAPNGSVAAILISDNEFIDFQVALHKDIRDSTQGEILAAKLALQLVERNFSTPQTIKIITDCKVVVTQINKLLSSKDDVKMGRYYKEWSCIKRMLDNHRVSVEHVIAHSKESSCNTICDRASRAILSLKG